MPRTKMKIEPSWREKAQRKVVVADAIKSTSNPGQPAFDYEVPTPAHGEVLSLAQTWRPSTTAEQISAEEKVHIEVIQAHMGYQVLWVIKEQSKMLTPEFRKVLGPERYAIFESQQHYGEILNCLYNMAWGIFDHLEIGEGQSLLQYESWGLMWYSLFSEKAQTMVDTTFTVGAAPSRQDAISRLKSLRKSLENWEVPRNIGTHHRNLLEHGAMIAKHNPRDKSTLKNKRKLFRKKYWLPYLEALQSCEQWTRGLARSDKDLPENVSIIWPQRDPLSNHFYVNTGGRKKVFPYRERL